ncbi:MAG: HisA/HisF-related TIM barrel protein [Verrucomicrobiota bacterium]
MLSRNFRLQRVGDIAWLQKNYNFSKITAAIDELVVLDVSRGQRDADKFCDTLSQLAETCFAPIAAGGGVRTLTYCTRLLRNGADKVVLNSPLVTDSSLVNELSREFGRQCLVASVDIRTAPEGGASVWIENGSCEVEMPIDDYWRVIIGSPIGEIYLNSINRDGTGQGYDFTLLDSLPKNLSIPVIFAGGVGNATHLANGLMDSRVDAVATANLFNFVGDGLLQARRQLIEMGFLLPNWDMSILLK